MIRPVRKSKRISTRFRLWSRQVRLTRKLAFLLSAAAVASGVATVATMTGTSAEEGPDTKTVVALLYMDVILALLLGGMVARRLAIMWGERRRGLAGSVLRTRFVLLFSLVAVAPAILVAVFAALFLNFGIQAWFSEKVRTVIDESHAVATAYLHEHQQNIRADVLAMANDINRQAPELANDPSLFDNALATQVIFRNLTEAVVVDSSGKPLARAGYSSLSLEFGLVPRRVLAEASGEGVALLTSNDSDRVRAVVKLNRMVDAYLLVGRFVEPQVLAHIERAQGAVNQYRTLEKSRKSIQISFVMIFVVVALLLLLAAVWIGLTVATQLVQPITRLIRAAEQVSEGDLGVRVDTSSATDELSTLSRGFNRMTIQLESQQQGLIEANRQLDERRRFTETVLAGVSAGVIGLDGAGGITLPNRSASELLAVDLEGAIGRKLGDVVPEMADILAQSMDRPDRQHRAEIRRTRNGGHQTLLATAAGERLGADIIGYVVTFDDVTELLSAQRTAAWADVARRIAHEIKNPLTPIQLSAERLKRKYIKEITTDPEIFTACTDTIVRQVEDIGRMVDEFSAFARMPEASLKPENLSEICRQGFFLERNRHPEITYALDLPERDARMECDSRQITQALTNLLKNAAESITGRLESEADSAPQGKIRLSIAQETGGGGVRTTISVEDNGKGLPTEHRDRLTEPYVTSRAKGTGLGLAIVKKIMEDHEGDLVLEDMDGQGARVSLVFRSAEGAGEAGNGAPDPMKVATGITIHGI